MAPASCARIVYTTEIGESRTSIRIRASADGTPVGEVTAGIAFGGSGPFSVGGSKVKPSFRRCGIATRLYELAAQAACDLGYKLASDTSRSSMSQGFWAKQVKKGRAKCIATADPVRAEFHEREFPTEAHSRYGRGSCDQYELVSCPVASLAGRKQLGSAARHVTDLPKLREDGDLVYRELPFPFRRKPQIPSRLHATAKVRVVPLALMHGSQRGVVERGVQQHMHDRPSSKPIDLPLVYAEHDGTFTIADGHHRLVAAYLRGQKTAKVRVVVVPPDLA